MNIRKATAADIPELVRLRVRFLNEVNGRACPPDGFEADLSRYFHAGMADGSFAAWVAREDDRIVATSGVCFYHLAPNYSNPSGGVAYILNMYTLPEHRGKGLASALFARLIEEARARGYKKLALHATADGKRVYEKFGFTEQRRDGIEAAIRVPTPADHYRL